VNTTRETWQKYPQESLLLIQKVLTHEFRSSLCSKHLNKYSSLQYPIKNINKPQISNDD